MDIVTAITAISKSLEAVKAIRDIDAGFDKAVLKGQLSDVMVTLADVKLALLDAQEESRGKDAEIKRLKDQFAYRGELVSHNGWHYKPSKADPAKPSGYPLCRRCEEIDGRLIQVVSTPIGNSTMCPNCKTNYSRLTVFAAD